MCTNIHCTCVFVSVFGSGIDSPPVHGSGVTLLVYGEYGVNS